MLVIRGTKGSRRAVDERFYKARDAFSTSRFKARYKVWKQDGEAALAEVSSHTIGDAVKPCSGQVEPSNSVIGTVISLPLVNVA